MKRKSLHACLVSGYEVKSRRRLRGNGAGGVLNRYVKHDKKKNSGKKMTKLSLNVLQSTIMERSLLLV